jgi:hypothetical protein
MKSLPRPFLSCVAFLAIGAVSASAAASGIFLNGVRVNGLKNHKFEGCTVKFDAQGNVHITAKGFKIKAILQSPATPKAPPPKVFAPPPPRPRPVPTPPRRPPPPRVKPKPKPAKPPGPITRKYFMVAMPSTPGKAQYDVDVYINRKWVRKIRNREFQVVVPITKFLERGKNLVHFAATKNYDGRPRQSTSTRDFIRVVIGSGTKGGGTFNITETFIDYKVTAARTDNFGHEEEFVPK